MSAGAILSVPREIPVMDTLWTQLSLLQPNEDRKCAAQKGFMDWHCFCPHNLSQSMHTHQVERTMGRKDPVVMLRTKQTAILQLKETDTSGSLCTYRNCAAFEMLFDRGTYSHCLYH